jgi:hypothetical protein
MPIVLVAFFAFAMVVVVSLSVSERVVPAAGARAAAGVGGLAAGFHPGAVGPLKLGGLVVLAGDDDPGDDAG